MASMFFNKGNGHSGTVCRTGTRDPCWNSWPPHWGSPLRGRAGGWEQSSILLEGLGSFPSSSWGPFLPTGLRNKACPSD